MRHLYHYWFCPNSRKVRISLLEKSMDCELILELPWKRRHEFLTLNPSGSVPVLVEHDDLILSGTSAICEYLEETGNLPNFLGKTPTIRGEVRRLSEWFDSKFYNEVTNLIINEKVMKGFLRRGNTQAANIRFAGQNIKHHLKYIEYLTDRRNWLAGSEFSYADISAAAQISCVDYFGDVPWNNFPLAKDWYARIKSRPSMQLILKDKIAGLTSASYYRDPDF
ncbi:MAG: glutathione S-transferase family protein [Kordiimonadaceae bacterium]|nr:glutathione S-transferase family protein [Kordiimonadaceae bacterium]MBT7545561.1 glutathione S-transferase family protein [Kordiimonadaceae bacterium]MDB4044168.1 glutathione S-transferase family protein [Emcibacteraceae bacterium]MDC1429421.1 glutathione S-transferase family protein [Emcibacteraceae bacterium]